MQFPSVRGRSGARVAAAPLAPPDAALTDTVLQSDANAESVQGQDRYRTSPSETMLDVAAVWPTLAANPAIPDVPEVPEDAVVVVEHPDGSAEVGIDCARLPKRPGRARDQRSQMLDNQMNAEAAAAFDALRQQQAAIYRTTVLRRRRIVFLILVVSDGLFFLGSLLYQLITGGLGSIKRKGMSFVSSDPIYWWLKPKELTLEEMALSLIIDLIGIVAGLQSKTYLVGLFVLLETIATVLVSLRGFSFFLLYRLLQLVAAMLLRSAIFHYTKLVLPDAERAQFESMFIGFRSYMHTINGFCWVLCGRDTLSLPPTRGHTRDLDALAEAASIPPPQPPANMESQEAQPRPSELGVMALAAAAVSMDTAMAPTAGAGVGQGTGSTAEGLLLGRSAASAGVGSAASGVGRGEWRHGMSAQTQLSERLPPQQQQQQQQQPGDALLQRLLQQQLQLQQQPGGAGEPALQAGHAGGDVGSRGLHAPVHAPTAATAVLAGPGTGDGPGSVGLASLQLGMAMGLPSVAVAGASTTAAAAPGSAAGPPNLAAVTTGVTIGAPPRVRPGQDAADAGCPYLGQGHQQMQAQQQCDQHGQLRVNEGAQSPRVGPSFALRQQLRRQQQQLQLSYIQRRLQQYQEQRGHGRRHDSLRWPQQGCQGLALGPDARCGSDAAASREGPLRQPQQPEQQPPRQATGDAGGVRTTARLQPVTSGVAGSGRAVAEGFRRPLVATPTVQGSLTAAGVGAPPIGRTYGLSPQPVHLEGLPTQSPISGSVQPSPVWSSAVAPSGTAGSVAELVGHPSGVASAPAGAAAAPAPAAMAAAAARAAADWGGDAPAKRTGRLQAASLLRSLRGMLSMQRGSPGAPGGQGTRRPSDLAGAAVGPSGSPVETWTTPGQQQPLAAVSLTGGLEAALLALAHQQRPQHPLQQQMQLTAAPTGSPVGGVPIWNSTMLLTSAPPANLVTIDIATTINNSITSITANDTAANTNDGSNATPSPQALSRVSISASQPKPSQVQSRAHDDRLGPSAPGGGAGATEAVAAQLEDLDMSGAVAASGPLPSSSLGEHVSAAAIAAVIAEYAQRRRSSHPPLAAPIAGQEAGTTGGRLGLGRPSPPLPTAAGPPQVPASCASIPELRPAAHAEGGTGRMQGGLQRPPCTQAQEGCFRSGPVDAELVGACPEELGVGADAGPREAAGGAAAVVAAAAAAVPLSEALDAVNRHSSQGPLMVCNAAQPPRSGLGVAATTVEMDTSPGGHLLAMDTSPGGHLLAMDTSPGCHLLAMRNAPPSTLSAALQAALAETQRLQRLAAERREQQQQQQHQGQSQWHDTQQQHPHYLPEQQQQQLSQQQLSALWSRAGPAGVAMAAPVLTPAAAGVPEEVPLTGVAAAARAAAAPFSRTSTKRTSPATSMQMPSVVPAAGMAAVQNGGALTAGQGQSQGQALPVEPQPRATQALPCSPAMTAATAAAYAAGFGGRMGPGRDQPVPELMTGTWPHTEVPGVQQPVRVDGERGSHRTQDEIWVDAVYEPCDVEMAASGRAAAGAQPRGYSRRETSTEGADRSAAAAAASRADASTVEGPRGAASATASATAVPGAAAAVTAGGAAAAAVAELSLARLTSHPIAWLGEAADVSEWIAGSAAAALMHDSGGSNSTGSGGGGKGAHSAREQQPRARARVRFAQASPAVSDAACAASGVGTSHGVKVLNAVFIPMPRFRATSLAAAQAAGVKPPPPCPSSGQRRQEAGGSQQAQWREAQPERRPTGAVPTQGPPVGWPSGAGTTTGMSRSVRLLSAGLLEELSPERK